MPTTVDNKLRVFLCHAKEDKPTVRDLYRQLTAEGWLDVWLDEIKLLPGQEWDIEIEKAVEQADVVIVCLSNKSVDKEGYVQKELRFVLNIADEKPEGTIFVIPLRLDDCAVPRRIRAWQYVDYFPKDNQVSAYQHLLKSLKLRAGKLEVSSEEHISQSNVGQVSNRKTTPALSWVGNATYMILGGMIFILLLFIFGTSYFSANLTSKTPTETPLSISTWTFIPPSFTPAATLTITPIPNTFYATRTVRVHSGCYEQFAAVGIIPEGGKLTLLPLPSDPKFNDTSSECVMVEYQTSNGSLTGWVLLRDISTTPYFYTLRSVWIRKGCYETFGATAHVPEGGMVALLPSDKKFDNLSRECVLVEYKNSDESTTGWVLLRDLSTPP
jgi:hypothetical protein